MEEYFNIQESRDLFNLGVTPDAYYHTIRPLVGNGWSYGDTVVTLASIEQKKPPHEIYRNEWYDPAILKPQI